MRHIGSLKSEKHAKRFTAFLLTKDVSSVAEEDGDEWLIWARDENSLEVARSEFVKFQADPDSQDYVTAEKAADNIRRENEKKQAQARKNVVEMRSNWGRGANAKRAPLIFILIGICIVIYLWNPDSDDPRKTTYLLFANIGAEDAFEDINAGQLWRLFTPAIMHGSIWHLVFNMYWLYYFGTRIESTRKTWRLALIVLATALTSAIPQAIIVGTNFLGMSGVVYGLFGYCLVKTYVAPQLNIQISEQVAILLVAWFFICMTGFVGSVANLAHFGGFAGGAVIAYVPHAFGSITSGSK